MAETRLKRIAQAVHQALGDLSVAARHDRTALSEHGQLRRIVWLTEGGTGEAAHQAGGRIPPGRPNVRVVSTWLRVETAQAHIYAEDRATCEELLDKVIAALDEECGPSFAGFSYRWVTEERPNAGVTLRASKCILTVQLREPVVVKEEPLHPLPAAETEYGLLLEDDTIAPHPDT